MSPDEYLALERQSETRSEYLDGEMFAMAGSSFNHNVIVGNVLGELRQQLKGRPCRVCPNDQRVHVPATGLYTYPDVVVVCGEPRFQDGKMDTLLNPILIVEVLSPNTEAYDRGEKLEHYQTIESLAEYVLVAQDRPRIDQYVRQDGGHWLLTAASSLEASLALPSIQCQLALAEVYDKVDFASQQRSPRLEH